MSKDDALNRVLHGVLTEEEKKAKQQLEALLREQEASGSIGKDKSGVRVDRHGVVRERKSNTKLQNQLRTMQNNTEVMYNSSQSVKQKQEEMYKEEQGEDMQREMQEEVALARGVKTDVQKEKELHDVLCGNELDHDETEVGEQMLAAKDAALLENGSERNLYLLKKEIEAGAQSHTNHMRIARGEHNVSIAEEYRKMEEPDEEQVMIKKQLEDEDKKHNVEAKQAWEHFTELDDDEILNMQDDDEE